MNYKTKKFINDFSRFLKPSELDIKPTQQCRTSLLISIITMIAVMNLQLFTHVVNLRFTLILTALMLTTTAFSIIAGIKLYRRQTDGYYITEKIKVKDVQRNLGEIKNLYAVNEYGQDLDLQVENSSIKLKKNHRYTVSYYENQNGELVIIGATHLGKFKGRLDISQED